MKKGFVRLAGLLAPTLITAAAFAEEVASTHTAASGNTGFALAIAAGFAIGVAALGGALGQGRAATAALEGIARNPDAAAKIQTPMIIALALIESLVIYALVIAFLLMGKI
ncbi:MAG: ATP synthase F0 subunit C [Deltaproteobacteria bacterium]|nr:ATP synthase F0 subunit C [Deltaproteobacteria bacterium]